MKRADVFPALFLALALAAQAPGPSWQTVPRKVRVELPRDLAPHPSYQTEWWYVTGLVSDPEGRRFGVQWTLFRRGLDPSERELGQSDMIPRQVLAGHVAVADLTTGTFRSGQRVRRVAAGLAGWSDTGTEIWLEDWAFEEPSAGECRVRGTASEGAMALDLTLRLSGGPVLQGDGGYSRKGHEEGNASAYFSVPRCEARGTLELDGNAFPVSGTLWLDREWGTTKLGAGVQGWDWFGLRLADGRSLTLYRLRTREGASARESSGTLAAAGGGTEALGPGDFALAPLEFWESASSHARYPTRWRIRVPSKRIEIEVSAPVRSCEVDGSRSTGSLYWEGPVSVTGSARGEGYMELTGYGSPLGEWF